MALSIDPTRDELLAQLHIELGERNDGCCQGEAGCYDADCGGCELDVEAAAYWLASDYHGGQSSNLYAALCASPFRPGPLERGFPDYEGWPMASALYDAVAWRLDRAMKGGVDA